MFLPYFIAILLGLVSPSQHNASCNHNTTVSVNGEGEPDPGDNGGTGGDDDGGTTGNTGQTPPPKP